MVDLLLMGVVVGVTAVEATAAATEIRPDQEARHPGGKLARSTSMPFPASTSPLRRYSR